MPEPAGDRAASGNPENGAGAAEFAELRAMLIGSELDELGAIKDRLDNPVRRAADLAAVLPDAVRGARPKALREAIEPVFEKSFQSSVRKHPRELADAIYPVIGPAIRKSIRSAIHEFAETLNQVVEKSVSLRAIRWRIEARMTGKPFSEILMARSLLYSVEQVFLIHRKSGLLLQHVTAHSSVLKDADMISGMLTAIQDFFNDSFTEGGQDLELVDAGQFRLWIQHGPKAVLVAAVSGSAPVALKNVLRNALEGIHERLYAELDTFKQEDPAVFEPARPFLEACLLGSSAPRRRRRILPRIMLWATVLAALAFGAWYVRDRLRWQDYFAALRQQPGIVVTSIEKRGSGYVVSGLKDPKAPDPTELPGEHGLDAGRIAYQWQPYLSLNTPYAAARERDAALQELERQIIRFEVGSSKLPLAESDRIEALAAAIRRLGAAARVAVVGHTDEVGSDESNVKLARDRAAHVVEALVAQGVPGSQLEALGAGNKEPLRTGVSEWDRATNRSVSFRVIR